MKLSENPFSLLKASPRDRKVRLIELSEEAELFGDHEAAVNARNILSNPRTRLSAEIAWFPGLRPKRVRDLLDQIAQYLDYYGHRVEIPDGLLSWFFWAIRKEDYLYWRDTEIPCRIENSSMALKLSPSLEEDTKRSFRRKSPVRCNENDR